MALVLMTPANYRAVLKWLTEKFIPVTDEEEVTIRRFRTYFIDDEISQAIADAKKEGDGEQLREIVETAFERAKDEALNSIAEADS